MTVRYRHRMNFTFNSLKASERALCKLRNRVWEWKSLPELAGQLPPETEEWRQKFWDAVNDDLDLPTALALTWDMVRSDLTGQAKLALLLDFDRIFGLDLDLVPDNYQLPEAIVTAASQRNALRDQVDYATADSLREELASGGYVVQDTPRAPGFAPRPPWNSRRSAGTGFPRPARLNLAWTCRTCTISPSFSTHITTLKTWNVA